MIKELSESLRYVGHYFALCFLRISIGIYIWQWGWAKWTGSYLTDPILAGNIEQWAVKNRPPFFIETLFTDYMRTYWSVVAYAQTIFELLAGFLLIIGFCVRPTSLLLVVYFWFFSYIEPQTSWNFINLFLLSLFTVSWAGAGRCLGIDYYFYKRRRGLLW